MSQHYYFFEKLKIVEKQLCKLNCSYGKVSHTLKDSKKVLAASTGDCNSEIQHPLLISPWAVFGSK